MASAATRRKVVSIATRRPPRKARVRKIHGNAWKLGRLELFKGALKFAAAAKAYRTALDVSQAEVAARLGVSTHCVTHRESGAYFGWSEGSLRAFNVAVDKAAAERQR